MSNDCVLTTFLRDFLGSQPGYLIIFFIFCALTVRWNRLTFIPRQFIQDVRRGAATICV